MQEKQVVMPITPQEAFKAKLAKIPSFVIEAFNDLIIESIDNDGNVRINQDKIIDKISSLAPPSTSRNDIFDKKWLDIEDIYKAQGWDVCYVKGAYYDTTPKYFTFKSKKEWNEMK